MSYDVIPPIPELSVQFNGNSLLDNSDLWLGICRAKLGDRPVEEDEEHGWTLGLFHMSDFPLFGQCVVEVDGGLRALVGGGFDIVQARMGTTCVQDPAVAAKLSADLADRVQRFLTDEDKARIERISGYPFQPMLDKTLKLDSCVMVQIMSPNRFVPHTTLNVEGLHLMRCVLAEKMADARRRALGYHKHPDYEQFMRDGVIFKDFDSLSDDELRYLLSTSLVFIAANCQLQYLYPC